MKSRKREVSKSGNVSNKAEDSINKLIQNNLEMQKVNLQLVESMNKLSNKIGDLIGLFEEAAKNVGVVDELKIKEETKDLSQRLDELLQQNRDLAKGLLLLEQYIRGRVSEQPMRRLNPQPLPRQ